MLIENCVNSIDKAFFERLSGRLNNGQFEKRLSEILTAADLNGSNKRFTVTIIDGKNEFLGLCCYPDMSQYSSVLQNSIADSSQPSQYNKMCELWFSEIRDWHIEIDKNCFDRRLINFTEKELTAMLLHELSHVVYSDRTVEKLYRAYKLNRQSLKHRGLNAAPVDIVLGVLYLIPGTIACGLHKASVCRDGLREEYICDKVFGIRDYQEHLVTAMDKIIMKFGTTSAYDTTGANEKKIDASVKWCNFNAEHMVFRRDSLKRDLVNMASGTRSRYSKNVILFVINKLGIGFKDRYTGDMVAAESVIEIVGTDELPLSGFSLKYDIVDKPKELAALELAIKTSSQQTAMEGVGSKIRKLPSGYDMDMIEVEIDRVEDHQDRIYVLDLIYARVDQINEFIDFYGENSQEVKRNKAKIDKYRKQLDAMRIRLLSKHNIDKSYRVFIHNPPGYDQ